MEWVEGPAIDALAPSVQQGLQNRCPPMARPRRTHPHAVVASPSRAQRDGDAGRGSEGAFRTRGEVTQTAAVRPQVYVSVIEGGP